MNKGIFSILVTLLSSIFPTVPFAQGFLHTSGVFIYDGNGSEVILRGIGTGNWLLNEGYMMKTADFAGTYTQFRTLLTETIGKQNAGIFYEN